MTATFEPLLGAPVLWIVGLDALAIGAVYLAVRGRPAGAWAPVVLRVLAVLGLVLPGWAIAGWYRDLERARELTRGIAVDTAPIAERFLLNSAALFALGFLLLVTGIYLARSVARTRPGGRGRTGGAP